MDPGTHPTQYGRYQILCHLAKCGMGTAYLAKDPNLSRAVAISLLVQAADRLRAADQMEVIHRDLKLANLLLHQDGVLKIADFGIAHWAVHST